MRNDLYTREWIHGFIAVILSLLLLAAAPQRQIFRSAVDVVGTVLSYPESPAVALERGIKRLSLWFTNQRVLQDRLSSLEAEITSLRLLHSMNSASAVVEAMERRIGHARVTLREPLSWWSEVRINRGLQNGVSIGASVLQNGALVGRVRSVGEDSSWVELITSTSSLIPVVIEETRDLGVVAGDGDGGLWLLYVPESRGLSEGMTVSTAMVSEALPPGIPVGKIAAETQDTAGFYRAWRILPQGTLSQLYTLEYLRLTVGAARDRASSRMEKKL